MPVKRNPETPEPELYIKVYKDGEEELYLHKGNAEVIRYFHPFGHYDHVEHWIGRSLNRNKAFLDKANRRRIWDPELINDLENNGLKVYELVEPRDPVMVMEYMEMKRKAIDELIGLDLLSDVFEGFDKGFSELLG